MAFWVFKRFVQKSLSLPAVPDNPVWPHVCSGCDADSIADADRQYREATGFDPCGSNGGLVMRHESSMCGERLCPCRER